MDDRHCRTHGSVKGVKGKRALLGPPAPTPKKPSNSRQKRVFLRFDPIDKNGGFCLNTLNKTLMRIYGLVLLHMC